MSFQVKVIALLVVLLAAAGWDDYRRAHAPVPAPAPAVVAQVQAAPAVAQRETERVVTQLKCSDGTQVTQTDSRVEAEQASAPVTATAQVSQQPATTQPSTAAPSRYSLRVDTNPASRMDIGVSVGARIGDLPLEVVGGAQLNSGSLSPRVGLQLDF